MIVRRLGALLAVAILGTTLAGCAAAGASTDDDRPTMVASFYPLAFVAERVGGAEIRLVNLTPPGVESHDLELTARQVGDVASADLVVYEKGLQPSVDEAVEQNAAGAVLDVTQVVDLRRGDPHVWLDPTQLAMITEAVADEAAEVAPEHADTFRQRADTLVTELTALDEDFRAGLADCERTTVVTSHEAFGYLADRYGLEMVSIAGLESDAEPSPARLKDVQRTIEDVGVTTVFYERLVSPEVAQTLADDLGISAAVLDPVEGLTEDTEGEDYLTLMRANLTALEEANGCT
ncbi:MAG TPA: metal ABC transporter substrate-binding protein [Jiangellaceae bacterium]